MLIGNGKMELDWKAVKIYINSKSWFIMHLQDQRVTGYHSFPGIGRFYLMCILVPSTLVGIPNHLIFYLMSFPHECAYYLFRPFM